MSQELQNKILEKMKVQNKFPFKFKYLDYECLIIYEDGYHNGYVGLKKDHPYYGMDYDDIDINVHGGLTFSSFGDDNLRTTFDENNNRLYWIGFDCAHSGDLIMDETWPWKCNKSPEYIANEIFEMVDQLIETKNQ